MTSAMAEPAVAPSRPPLIAERCFLTQFRSAMPAPSSISAAMVAPLSSSVRPGAGTASSDEAPPDNNTRSAPPDRLWRARASARRPPASLAASGRGCPPAIHSNRAGSGPAPMRGPASSPASIPSPGTSASPEAIGHAALPAAITKRGRPSSAGSARADATRRRGSTASTAARSMCRRSSLSEGRPLSETVSGRTSWRGR